MSQLETICWHHPPKTSMACCPVLFSEIADWSKLNWEKIWSNKENPRIDKILQIFHIKDLFRDLVLKARAPRPQTVGCIEFRGHLLNKPHSIVSRLFKIQNILSRNLQNKCKLENNSFQITTV